MFNSWQFKPSATAQVDAFGFDEEEDDDLDQTRSSQQQREDQNITAHLPNRNSNNDDSSNNNSDNSPSSNSTAKKKRNVVKTTRRVVIKKRVRKSGGGGSTPSSTSASASISPSASQQVLGRTHSTLSQPLRRGATSFMTVDDNMETHEDHGNSNAGLGDNDGEQQLQALQNSFKTTQQYDPSSAEATSTPPPSNKNNTSKPPKHPVRVRTKTVSTTLIRKKSSVSIHEDNDDDYYDDDNHHRFDDDNDDGDQRHHQNYNNKRLNNDEYSSGDLVSQAAAAAAESGGAAAAMSGGGAGGLINWMSSREASARNHPHNFLHPSGGGSPHQQVNPFSSRPTSAFLPPSRPNHHQNKNSPMMMNNNSPFSRPASAGFTLQQMIMMNKNNNNNNFNNNNPNNKSWMSTVRANGVPMMNGSNVMMNNNNKSSMMLSQHQHMHHNNNNNNNSINQSQVNDNSKADISHLSGNRWTNAVSTIFPQNEISRVSCLCAGPSDSSIVFIGGEEDGRIHVVLAGTSDIILELEGHTAAVVSLSFDSRSNTLFSSSIDAEVRIWNCGAKLSIYQQENEPTNSWPCIMSLAEAHHGLVVGLCSYSYHNNNNNIISKNKRNHSNNNNNNNNKHQKIHLFTGGDDRVIKLWDFETGKCKLKMKGHRGPVNVLVNDPLLPCVLYSGATDGFIKLWCVPVVIDESIDEIAAAFVRGGGDEGDYGSGAVDFESDEEESFLARILKSSPDQDGESGACLQTVNAHSDGGVWSLLPVFTNHQQNINYNNSNHQIVQKLVSGGADGIVKVWTVIHERRMFSGSLKNNSNKKSKKQKGGGGSSSNTSLGNNNNKTRGGDDDGDEQLPFTSTCIFAIEFILSHGRVRPLVPVSNDIGEKNSRIACGTADGTICFINLARAIQDGSLTFHKPHAISGIVIIQPEKSSSATNMNNNNNREAQQTIIENASSPSISQLRSTMLMVTTDTKRRSALWLEPRALMISLQQKQREYFMMNNNNNNDSYLNNDNNVNNTDNNDNTYSSQPMPTVMLVNQTAESEEASSGSIMSTGFVRNYDELQQQMSSQASMHNNDSTSKHNNNIITRPSKDEIVESLKRHEEERFVDEQTNVRKRRNLQSTMTTSLSSKLSHQKIDELVLSSHKNGIPKTVILDELNGLIRRFYLNIDFFFYIPLLVTVIVVVVLGLGNSSSSTLSIIGDQDSVIFHAGMLAKGIQNEISKLSFIVENVHKTKMMVMKKNIKSGKRRDDIAVKRLSLASIRNELEWKMWVEKVFLEKLLQRRGKNDLSYDAETSSSLFDNNALVGNMIKLNNEDVHLVSNTNNNSSTTTHVLQLLDVLKNASSIKFHLYNGGIDTFASVELRASRINAAHHPKPKNTALIFSGASCHVYSFRLFGRQLSKFQTKEENARGQLLLQQQQNGSSGANTTTSTATTRSTFSSSYSESISPIAINVFVLTWALLSLAVTLFYAISETKFKFQYSLYLKPPKAAKNKNNENGNNSANSKNNNDSTTDNNNNNNTNNHQNDETSNDNVEEVLHRPLTFMNVVSFSVTSFTVLFDLALVLSILTMMTIRWKWGYESETLFDSLLLQPSGDVSSSSISASRRLFDELDQIADSTEGAVRTSTAIATIMITLKIIKFLPMLPLVTSLSSALRNAQLFAPLFALVVSVLIFAGSGMVWFGSLAQSEDEIQLLYSRPTASSSSFSTFASSIMTVLRLLLGDTQHIPSQVSSSDSFALYFWIVWIFGRFILMNILISFLIEGFESWSSTRGSVPWDLQLLVSTLAPDAVNVSKKQQKHIGLTMRNLGDLLPFFNQNNDTGEDNIASRPSFLYNAIVLLLRTRSRAAGEKKSGGNSDDDDDDEEELIELSRQETDQQHTKKKKKNSKNKQPNNSNNNLNTFDHESWLLELQQQLLSVAKENQQQPQQKGGKNTTTTATATARQQEEIIISELMYLMFSSGSEFSSRAGSSSGDGSNQQLNTGGGGTSSSSTFFSYLVPPIIKGFFTNNFYMTYHSFIAQSGWPKIWLLLGIRRELLKHFRNSSFIDRYDLIEIVVRLASKSIKDKVFDELQEIDEQETADEKEENDSINTSSSSSKSSRSDSTDDDDSTDNSSVKAQEAEQKRKLLQESTIKFIQLSILFSGLGVKLWRYFVVQFQYGYRKSRKNVQDGVKVRAVANAIDDAM